MKRLFLLFFSALLCTTVSAHDFEVDGIYYNITSSSDLTVSVTYRGNGPYSYSNEYYGSVVIPEKVTYDSKEYSVTSIGDYAFRGCSGLTSVTIPNSVTSIGSYAFDGCSGLTSVTIGNSVTSIGSYAFDGCSGLASVTIPNSVISIGSWAFYNCSSLTSVTIPNSVTSIGDYAFRGCSGLTSVTIGNSVTSIGYEAFYGCSGLASVDIPNSVTSIGGSAFQYCSGLLSVTIPNSVTSIGSWAFDGCSGMTAVHITDLSAWCKIEFGINSSNPTSYAHHLYLNGEEIINLVIPDDVTSIGNYAFEGCSGLLSVTIPNSVTSIGNSAFWDCSGLTSVTIPNSITKIESGTFSGCSGLKSVTIPNSVTSIGNVVFSGCSGLTSVTIPNSVTSIGNLAFQYCSGLASVTIPDSVTSIGWHAFYGCSGLASVDIPNSVTSIGDWAFYGCTSLQKINCQAETPPAAYTNTFSSEIYTKATLNVPEGCSDKYKAANIWKEFTNMTAGGVVPEEPKQCAAPVITYADGKLQFACETAGAEYMYTLTASDAKSSFEKSAGSVDLTACYDITAYAVAEGYKNSEQVTATLYWINGSDVSTNINQTEMRGVMAICSGGIITVSGLAENETVEFYTASGSLLYTATAQGGTVSYAPSATGVVIVKIGKASIKVTV